MKRLPLRYRITLWFSGALFLVVLFTYIAVLSVSNEILQKAVRDSLIETVESNFSEVRFYDFVDGMDTGRDTSRFLAFGSGYLEVNDDFLKEINEVYTAVYDSEGMLLYGENPVLRDTVSVGFKDSQIQRKKIGKVTYYIFDRKLAEKGLEGFWLRGVVPETKGAIQMTSITRISLILLPVIVLASFVGGYYIVKRMLRPINQISETARQIGKENDLKKRIELGSGKDELHQLADAFNEMFARLEKSFETQRQFVSDASHELRTPMTVILAQCEYSLEQQRTPEEYQDAFRTVRRQSRKMSGMIGDMLDFARLEAGAERYVMEPVDMTAFVKDVCGDMALIGEKGIVLKYEAQEGIVFTGCRELLSRMLTNLIGNAYRYGKPEGHIWVRLAGDEEKLSLSVEDDGIGIAKEEQEKIFQRFYQADNSHAGLGSGLGLSMADEIARFHGGTLRVESEPDKGSIFTFTVCF